MHEIWITPPNEVVVAVFCLMLVSDTRVFFALVILCVNLEALIYVLVLITCVAFGPPGRLNAQGTSVNGDTNVSVIVSKVPPGFSLRGTLGTPTSAAEKLLSTSLAPEGSGRVATLLEAEEDVDRRVYQFTYVVDRGERGVKLRAISVISASPSGDTLINLTVWWRRKRTGRA